MNLRLGVTWAVLAVTPIGYGEVLTKTVEYEHRGVKLKGHLAWEDSYKDKLPGALVVHEFWGLNEYAKKRANQLAALGYVAFAIDMYGDGKFTEHPEEAGKMASAVRENIGTWLGRTEAGLKILRDHERVDARRIAAIGYCFGGSTVLQMAYNGIDVAAVVSFHGSLPIPESTAKIKARILICHGADDPFVKQETVDKLRSILDAGKVGYRFVAYPGAVHSFTVPGAEQRGMKGAAYNESADKQSWQDMLALFKEVFKD